MVDAEESLGARIERVRFQTSAAEIQYGLTQTLLAIQQVLDDLFHKPYTPSEGFARVPGLSERFSGFVHEWGRLTVPEEFRPEWAAFQADVERLRPLIDTLAELEIRSKRPDKEEIVRLQKAFSSSIEQMNVVERRLLEKERSLSGH